jgi:hypothetical protein
MNRILATTLIVFLFYYSPRCFVRKPQTRRRSPFKS